MDDRVVLEASRDADAVLLTNDAAAIAELFADEWVYLDGSGYTSKAQLIEWIRSGHLAHHTMRTIGDVRVQWMGDVALLSGRRASTGRWDGSEYAVEEYITDVLAQRGGRWVCMFTQKTALPG
jgi:ketosteroid isomerase-like protein